MLNAFTSTACSSSPCLHDGTCILDSSHTYHCACLGGYTGKNCEHGELEDTNYLLFVGVWSVFLGQLHTSCYLGESFLFRNRKHLVTTKPSLAGLLCLWCITKELRLVTRLKSVVWKKLRPAACLFLVFGRSACLDRLMTDTWAHAKDLKTQWEWSRWLKLHISLFPWVIPPLHHLTSVVFVAVCLQSLTYALWSLRRVLRLCESEFLHLIQLPQDSTKADFLNPNYFFPKVWL